MMMGNTHIVRDEAEKTAGVSNVVAFTGDGSLVELSFCFGIQGITEVSQTRPFLLRPLSLLGYSRADATCLRKGRGVERERDFSSLGSIRKR
jgi:hypothetical protein